jgi:hypothetical protein
MKRKITRPKARVARKARSSAGAKKARAGGVTVALDRDVANWFSRHVDASGARNLQAAVNEALRGFITSQEEALQRALRKIVREELRRAGR